MGEGRPRAESAPDYARHLAVSHADDDRHLRRVAPRHDHLIGARARRLRQTREIEIRRPRVGLVERRALIDHESGTPTRRVDDRDERQAGVREPIGRRAIGDEQLHVKALTLSHADTETTGGTLPHRGVDSEGHGAVDKERATSRRAIGRGQPHRLMRGRW